MTRTQLSVADRAAWDTHFIALAAGPPSTGRWDSGDGAALALMALSGSGPEGAAGRQTASGSASLRILPPGVCTRAPGRWLGRALSLKLAARKGLRERARSLGPPARAPAGHRHWHSQSRTVTVRVMR